MSLLNSLYHITSADGQGKYEISFDAGHSIFAGHFPGNPIVPGACLVQIAEELLSQHLGQPIRWINIHNLKFRQIVTPDLHIVFALTSQANNKCSVLITCLDNLHAQFTATYLCAHSNL